MPNSKSEEDFNIMLAQLVEKYPCLYDYTRKEYNNIAARAAAWQDIADTLAVHASADGSVSVEDCKLRWKSLRGCITRDKKFARQGNKVKKPYYLVEHLEFIKPFTRIATRTSRSTVRLVSSIAEVEESFINDPNLHGAGGVQEISSPNPTEQNIVKGESSQQNAQKDTDCSSLLRPGNNNNNNNKLRDDFTPATDDENPDATFFKSILPDVGRMNPRQKSTFRLGVVSLIDQVLYGSAETQFTLEPQTISPACSTVVTWNH